MCVSVITIMCVCVRVCGTYSSIKKFIVVLLLAYFPTSGYSTTCFFLAVRMFSSSPGLLKFLRQVFRASLTINIDVIYRGLAKKAVRKDLINGASSTARIVESSRD